MLWWQILITIVVSVVCFAVVAGITVFIVFAIKNFGNDKDWIKRK